MSVRREAVEAGLGEEPVERLVEGMSLGLGQVVGCDEQRVLPVGFASPHRHRVASVNAVPELPRYDSRRVKRRRRRLVPRRRNTSTG